MNNLRKAEEKDIPEILRLIKELAVFEKAPDEVINTEERIKKEGFGANPAFGCYLAEIDGIVAGMALYYYRYSTWKGRRLYLEDLYVSEKYRGHGYGKLLFDKMIEQAKADDCSGMMWQVLDWNKSAIEFYDKYATRYDEGWINCHLDF